MSLYRSQKAYIYLLVLAKRVCQWEEITAPFMGESENPDTLPLPGRQKQRPQNAVCVQALGLTPTSALTPERVLSALVFHIKSQAITSRSVSNSSWGNWPKRGKGRTVTQPRGLALPSLRPQTELILFLLLQGAFIIGFGGAGDSYAQCRGLCGYWVWLPFRKGLLLIKPFSSSGA